VQKKTNFFHNYVEILDFENFVCILVKADSNLRSFCRIILHSSTFSFRSRPSQIVESICEYIRVDANNRP